MKNEEQHWYEESPKRGPFAEVLVAFGQFELELATKISPVSSDGLVQVALVRGNSHCDVERVELNSCE